MKSHYGNFLSAALALAVMVNVTGDGVLAANPEGPLARPPEFPPAVENVFFPDVREQLVGPRPSYERGTQRGTGGPVAQSPAGGAAAESTGYAWSELVDADSIEAEIKRQLPPLQPLIATPATFKGGAYRECRDRFNTLAVLFAVAADFDEPVRWQDTAGPLSRIFARASGNCKVGTDQSFRESQQRVSDLAELVRGGRPTIDAPPAEDDTWERVADRTPLMVRMEQALNEAITPNLSSSRDLTSHADELQHEAKILALLGHILTQPGLPDAGDETYDGYAAQLRDGAVALSTAIEQEDFNTARTALGTISQACAACHDEYR